MNIEVSDKELFELIGRKEVELYSAQKELDAYRISIEKVKGLATEVETLRAGKLALESSNKQLSGKNVELDQALTTARKERDAIRTELMHKDSALEEVQTALKEAIGRAEEAEKNIVTLNQTIEESQKTKKTKK